MGKPISILFVLILLLSLVSPAVATENTAATTPTGYTNAAQVEYLVYSGTVKVNSNTVSVKNVVVNWGARNETATFLTTYATDYYTGTSTWETLSALSGGTGAGDAYKSELYRALQQMMKSKHTHQTNYGETRAYYGFTDCVRNDHSQIVSFYSGNFVSSTWNGKSYNREHTWPNSKGLGGSDEDDLMMLRPTISSENTSRGNTAYGESSGYFDPGADVRGDCARILLYTYVRWGNTGMMWGSSGVMESMEVLLKWMQEDPVDTWEMGRNDAVQSVTGVRNVFVDYPEYAWLLFGQAYPANLVTPSGNGAICTHRNTKLQGAKSATCTESGYSGDTYCADCGEKLKTGTTIAATGHSNTRLQDQTDATCGAEGYSGDTYCADCGTKLAAGETIPATGTHTMVPDTEGGTSGQCCSVCGYRESKENEKCSHSDKTLRSKKDATCEAEGYTGDTYCTDCGELLANGTTIPATDHSYDADGSCSLCGVQQQTQTEQEKSTGDIWITVLVLLTVSGCIVFLILKKRQ